MAKLKPVKNYRVARGKRNCGNCGHKGKDVFVRGSMNFQWFECQRPYSVLTYSDYVCKGHKQEAKDE